MWPTSCGFKNVDMQAIMEVAILQWTRLGALPDTRQNSTLIQEQASKWLDVSWKRVGRGHPPRSALSFWHHGKVALCWPYRVRLAWGTPVVCTLGAARGARLAGAQRNFQGMSGISQGRSPARNARGAHAMAGSGCMGVLWCAVQRVVVLLHLFNAPVWHSNSCNART